MRRRTAVLLLPLAACLLALSACGSGEPEAVRDTAGAVASAGAVDAFTVSNGDCLVQPAELVAASPDAEGTEVDSLRAVPCSEPHDGEVFHTFDLPDGEFPGDQPVIDSAETGCTTEFEPFVGTAYDDSKYELTYLYPTEQSWTSKDDREVACIVTPPQGEMVTGSLKGKAE